MKYHKAMKTKVLLLFALLLGAMSCNDNSDVVNNPVEEMASATITVAIPDATRATDEDAFDASVLGSEYELRYILGVRNDSDNRTTTILDTKYSTATTVTFDIKLVERRNYRIVVWADVVEKSNHKDRFYNTANGLEKVVVKEDKWGLNDATRDAFFAYIDVYSFSSQSDIEGLNLTRPLAKLKVEQKGGTLPSQVAVAYDSVATVFNAYDGSVSGYKSKRFSRVDIADAANGVILTDYIFASKDGDIVDISLNTYLNGAENVLNLSDISLKRNTLTTIQLK